MTNTDTEKPRKQLYSKAMNNLAADMAQLIDDPGVRSGNSEVSISQQSLPYGSEARHPSCSLSDECVDATECLQLPPGGAFRLIMTYH